MTLLAPPALHFGVTDTLKNTLTALGLTSQLQLCLDAGDASSFTSGDKWLDTSGHGYDFYRGTSSSGDAAEPTFNGAAGKLTAAEYWSFDGGDYFTYDTTNETWMQNLHKDNAAFTIAMWIYRVAGGTLPLVCTYDNASSPFRGILFFVIDGGANDGVLAIDVESGSSAALFQGAGSLNVAADAWSFVAISLDESIGTDGINYRINDATATDPSTYSSPSSSNATATMKIGGYVNHSWWMTNGSRTATFAMWSRALSAAELDSMFQATRGRFGI